MLASLATLRRLKKIDSVPSVAGVELNLACPNVIGHPIIAYDFDQMDDVMSKVAKLKLKKVRPSDVVRYH